MVTTVALSASACAGALGLDAVLGGPGIVSLRSAGEPQINHVVTLQRSTDLRVWQEVARVFGCLHSYPDAMGTRGSAFYRLSLRPAVDSDDWSNQFQLGATNLLKQPANGGTGAAPFVKFSIVLEQPHRVYFQDSARYPYHYHFVTARLEDFLGISWLDFDRIALRVAGQKIAVGSLILAPDPQIREAGLEIAGSEVLPVARIVEWLDTVRTRLVGTEGWRFYYMPSFEQLQAARDNEAFFRERGYAVESTARWVTENVCYSQGWALGRLVWVPGVEIAAATAEGRLRFADILMTDRVPAELPLLAGVIVFEPATPNSHVALLAQSFAVPFVFVQGTGLQEQIRSLDGREVLVVAEETTNRVCDLRVTDVTGRLSGGERERILALKKPPALAITPIAMSGQISLPADTLAPDAVRFVGGKAAHFGFLRRVLPDHSPSPAIALTYDLWQAYLDQVLISDKTLRQEIADRLGKYSFPPDVASLRSDLAAVRNLITGAADFTPAQEAAILSALTRAGFDPARKIRFRSSTNVEDTELFTGAGLYDSYSGCLADELDGDSLGPSQCDPAEPLERGVFRALRKVYASFYNENAFIERRRFDIREADVGMAVLVHHSYPDEFEMANGVATLEIARTNGSRTVAARLVTQTGAVSVTNPDAGLSPEIVDAGYTNAPGAAVLAVTQFSGLVTNNSPVLVWETEYRALLGLLDAAALAYEDYFTSPESLTLDFEYKKEAPGNLSVKQMRRIPRPERVPPPVIE